MSNYGFVYVMANKAMPDIFKIGMTDRSPYSRADDLSNSTSVPYPFEVVFYMAVEDARQIELITHESLSEFRVNSKREFFKAHLSQIVLVMYENGIDHVLTNRGSSFFTDEIIDCIEIETNTGKSLTEGQWLLYCMLDESAKGHIKYLCGTDISKSAPPIQHEPNIFQLKKLTEEKKGFSLKEKNNGTI